MLYQHLIQSITPALLQMLALGSKDGSLPPAGWRVLCNCAALNKAAVLHTLH